MKRLALLLLLGLTGCVTVLPPKPPDLPQPPVTCGLFVKVFNGPVSGGHKVPGAVVTVAGRTALTDGAGNVPTALGLFPPGDYFVNATAEGYQPSATYMAHLCVTTSIDVELTPIPVPSTLPRWIRRDGFVQLESGEWITAIEASDFNLFARFQSGEDITPILQQRATAGFNLLRVWTLYNLEGANIGVLLNPDYAQIPAFLALCAKYGLWVEFTAYTSTWDPLHWGRLTQAVTPWTLVELVNELDQVANALPPEAMTFTCPAPLLCSHGSNGAEAWPVMPLWGYGTFHTNGAFEEQRKVGHNAWEIWEGPTLTNETSRYPDVGMWVGADLTRQQQLAYDAAAGATLLAMGSCFHSVQGKRSVLWDGNTLAVARAWAAGAKSVPLTCQAGEYYHRAELETTGVLRVYQRGTDPACIVTIRQ
jgi:hypothetical protein